MQPLTIEKIERDNEKARAIHKYLSHFEKKQKRETKISLTTSVACYFLGSRLVSPIGYRLMFAMVGYMAAVKANDYVER